MAGLLSGIGSKVGGLLGDPNLKDAFWLTLASGADPRRASMLKEDKRIADEEARMEEYRKIQMEQARMQMQQAQDAQQRQQYTQALLSAGSSQNPALMQDPTFQAQLRQKAAAYGDPAALEQGGLLTPLPTSQKMPMSYIEHQLGQDNPAYAQFLQQRQAAGGGAAPYFQPVFTANGVQAFDARTGQTFASPGGEGGIPLPQDPAQQAAIMRQKAIGENDAKFEGAVQVQAPQLMGSVNRLTNLTQMIDKGDVSTGVLVGSVYKLADPQTALLEAESIQSSVEALNGSGLAPVSNKELEVIREMFASANKTGTINKVLLERSLNIAKRQLATLQSKDAYFREKGTLEGWRPQGFGSEAAPAISPGSSPAQGNAEAERAALRAKHGIQ